jgi:CBS domain-containing protein
MTITARDVMTTTFHTLLPNTPVVEAVKSFKRASEEEQKRVFGMMVTNDKGRLIGMLSMYDILLFMRPKHIHIWGMMEDIDVTGLLDNACERARSVQVGDIMTTEVVTITPETHVMMILDIMIKKHVRRIPVVENDSIHGIVYISDLFYQLLGKLGE